MGTRDRGAGTGKSARYLAAFRSLVPGPRFLLNASRPFKNLLRLGETQ